MVNDADSTRARGGIDPGSRAYMDSLIAEIREHGHAVSGPYVGRDALVLTTIGARSGQPRSNPVAFTRDGERFVIAGTNDGADAHAGWYWNAVAHPAVTIEVDRRRSSARARVAEGDERERLWALHVANHPGLAAYPSQTSRTIPVLVLEPLAADASGRR
jgi:deazaflavin-dependent oxidoreductase (nitroreductase family)